MADTVVVSLLQRRGYRASKDEEFTWYGPGLAEMPLQHARDMGVLQQIVGVSVEGEPLPFGGAFDEALTKILTDAGYTSIAGLQAATDDELLSIDGVGPAKFEEIRRVTGGI